MEIKEELLIAYECPPIKTDILIVFRNQPKYLDNCLKSIFETSKNFNVYLWDNGSDEATQKIAKSYDVNYHRSEENLGFIIPNNRLAAMGSSPYIILLNSDTMVFEYWDTAMVGILEKNKELGMVGYLGGKLDERMQGDVYFKGYNCDYICGWALCLPRKLYNEIGLFDEENLKFAYGEDSDLSLRIKEKGYKIYALSSELIWHAGSKTTKEVIFERPKELSKFFADNHEYLRKRWKKN